MSSSFDSLWNQVSKGQNQTNVKSNSFDDLWVKTESSQPKKRSNLEKGFRSGAQLGLGILQGSPSGLVFESAVAPLASKEAQMVPYRENLMQDIERLQEQKQAGVWDQQDQELYDNLIEQVKDTSKSEPYIKTSNLGIRDIAEKLSGEDLTPEGILEHGANWMGFIKNPKNVKNIFSAGIKPKDVRNAILPTGSEFLRGITAGTALEMADRGDFGPIGTMGAVVLGDLVGAGVAGGLKGANEFITKPKETLAKVAASFTPKEKLNLQKDIVKDFREAGLQADLGTVTDSNIIKWTQSRLAQSGLTGKALDDFRQELTSQIKNEYKEIADALGEYRFATNHEAGEAAKSWMTQIRDKDLIETRKFYQEAEKSLKDKAFVDSRKLADAIGSLERSLKPGQIKSGEQNVVLNALSDLKRDIFDSEGNLIYGSVKDLMNNKIALNDIINYEVQGGAKQLLKGIVNEIDRAIISHGKESPKFAKNYINANKRFSQHAKTFRSKSADQMLKTQDPSQLLNKMNSVQGIRNIGNILQKSPLGEEVFNSLKRFKLEKAIGDNLVDSTTQQVKLGTFSKLLEKGKNAEVIKEILGAEGFKRLQRLQKNAGRLADASQKFYNESKSGAVAVDAALLSQGISAIANVLIGNPWPFMRIGGTLLGARKLSKLFADPEFLKFTEDVILASEKKSDKSLIEAVERLKPYILQFITQENQDLQE